MFRRDHVFRHGRPRELEQQKKLLEAIATHSIGSTQLSYVKFFSSSPPLSCEKQEAFWEAQTPSVFATRQLSCWWSSGEAGQFCVKQTQKMTGRRWVYSRKSICKLSLGRLLFTVLYKVNGNQGATIPESSPPLILNNEIKMGSLYLEEL